MYLVICEKPSVAIAIGKVLGAYRKEDGYIAGRECMVSWCFGHLAEYAMPEVYDEKYLKWSLDALPIIPDEWKLVVTKDKAKQFGILKKLLTGGSVPVDYVVNACDAGREGELIFKRVYDLSGSRLPVKRLWISSMEDQAIKEGFENLRDGVDYRDLANASVCRAQADWLIGMNASRAFTKTYDYRMTVGRVQTPTLSMLVKRSGEISGFKKEQYFITHLIAGDISAVSRQLADRREADLIAAMCGGKRAVVRNVKKEEKSISPPLLYDLTTLQREANRLFGFTAKQTLQYAQSLYEKKLLTYPRTDSRYLTDDMDQAAAGMIIMLHNNVPFIPDTAEVQDINRLLDSSKVSDHHAIIPTAEYEKLDITSLPDGEQKILLMAANRFLCAAGKKHQYLSVKAQIECEGYTFEASGRTILENGWKSYSEAFKQFFRVKGDNNELSEKRLPDLYEGEVFQNVSTKVSDHWTKPPAYYTEDSLLAAMERAGRTEMEDDVERKGLGTPATRAGIIEKLISSGYAVRNKKQVISTEAGDKMISLMPDYLKSAQMTADWENRLLMMERGKCKPDEFMDDIKTLVGTIVDDCRNIPPADRSVFTAEKKPNTGIGKCPLCGSPVREGKKNFYCSNRECSFALWKENRYLANMKKRIDKRMAADLLLTGRTYAKDFYSAKTSKNFEAALLMDVAEDGRVTFHMEFPDGNNR